MKLRNNSGDIQSDPDKMTSEGAPITKQDVIDGRVYPNSLVYMKYLMQCESEENPKTLGVQSLHGDGKTAEKRLCLKTPFFLPSSGSSAFCNATRSFQPARTYASKTE